MRLARLGRTVCMHAKTAGSACAIALFAAGCASDGSGGSTSLPGGQSCTAVRAQLAKLDRAGVPAYVQAMSAGKKLSKAKKAKAKLYNRLLDDYLKARCHV